MKHFWRSLHYMFAYRVRLIGAVVCVLLIGILWAGGLGALIPGAKVLISDEGLHGWADQTLVNSRLQIGAAKLPLDRPVDGQTLGDVILVQSVESDGPSDGQADDSRLGKGEYIIALDGQYKRFEPLYQHLAAQQADQPLKLRVWSPERTEARWVTIRPAEASAKARWLYRLAERLPRDDRFGLLLSLLAFGLVLTLLRNIFRFIQEYLVQTTVMRAMVDLRCETFANTIRLPLGHFSERGTSDTMSRFLNDIGELGGGLTILFGKTLVEPAKLIATMALALYLDWRLTLLACVAGPPAYMLIRKLGKLMRGASQRALQNFSRMLGVLEETFTGIRVVKAYTTEQTELDRFRKVNRQLYREQKPMVAIDSASSPLVEALGITAALGATAIAGYWVFHGTMDRELFLGLMACLAAMFDPLRKLSRVATRFHRADAAAERIWELHDQPFEPDPDDGIELPRHSDSIEFKNVTFSYPRARRPALSEVSLWIQCGESIAVVGPNGSGKTTLLSMLPRFFIPGSGTIEIDGVDLSKVRLKSLRSQIGIVTQETVLFNATVAENIAYGRPGATMDQIRMVARQAFVEDFLDELPDGYDTLVAERGVSLSGGQRQRISIARAILRDPAILIFDEATSQVDSESEAKIHQALRSFMSGRTTIMIAHRFSTVMSADRLVVMSNGRIVDVGGHSELLARCAVYRSLFETQLVRDS